MALWFETPFISRHPLDQSTTVYKQRYSGLYVSLNQMIKSKFAVDFNF